MLTKSVARDLGFATKGAWSREYLRIDLCFYSPADIEKGWNIEVAIEHENGPGKWIEEWVKLLHVSAGLRVIIGYERSKVSAVANVKLAKRLSAACAYRAPGPTLLILGSWRHPNQPFHAYSIGLSTVHSVGKPLHLPSLSPS